MLFRSRLVGAELSGLDHVLAQSRLLVCVESLARASIASTRARTGADGAATGDVGRLGSHVLGVGASEDVESAEEARGKPLAVRKRGRTMVRRV